jgi:hypothetical protein
MYTDVSEMLAVSFIRTISKLCSRKFLVLVVLYQNKRRNVPEDSHFDTRSLENL